MLPAPARMRENPIGSGFLLRSSATETTRGKRGRFVRGSYKAAASNAPDAGCSARTRGVNSTPLSVCPAGRRLVDGTHPGTACRPSSTPERTGLSRRPGSAQPVALPEVREPGTEALVECVRPPGLRQRRRADLEVAAPATNVGLDSGEPLFGVREPLREECHAVLSLGRGRGRPDERAHPDRDGECCEDCRKAPHHSNVDCFDGVSRPDEQT